MKASLKWAAMAAVIVGMSTQSVLAHEAECPYCSLSVLQNTAKQDNEVELKTGAKKIDYRCVYCALSDASSEYKGNVSIKAPTEVKGKFVTLTRKGGKWSSTMPNVVFVAQKANHRHCQDTYRVLSSRRAFPAYAKKNPLVAKSKPLTLAQMLQVAK